MLVSAKLIEELVLSLAEIAELNTRALSNLIYHLKFPGEEVPHTIADVIAGHTALNDATSRLPGRLAYGVIENCLALYDISQRHREQSQLCRQVNRIRLHLEQREYPVRVIDSFEEKFAQLMFAAEAASDLARPERALTNPELVVLVEQLMTAMLAQAELTKLLLARIVSPLRPVEKNSIAVRVADALREGLTAGQTGCAPGEDCVLTIDEPVVFRAALRANPSFAEAAWDALEQLRSLAGKDNRSVS